MEESEIKEAFLAEVHKRSFGREAGLTKDQVYDYRKRVKEDNLTTAIMLEVLWKLDKLEFKL